jgi:hypothetical protein
LLGCCRVTRLTDVGIGSLSACKRLQALNLTGCKRVTEEALLRLALCCIALHTLNLDACDRVSDNGIRQMADGLSYAQVR